MVQDHVLALVAVQGSCRLAFAAIVLTSLARDAAGEVGRSALGEVSEKVVALYNKEDARALHAMLAPDVRKAWPLGQFTARLADCRRRFGVLERVSRPVMGSRTYGFIAAYFATAGRDMFLEIDPDGFIRVLTFRGQSDICPLGQR